MLKILRNDEFKKKILWVVTIIIILSFGFFGTSYLLIGLKNNHYAGKVFGKNISLADFEQAYQIMYIQALIQYGENFSKIKEYLNLDAQTWDHIILIKDAERKKIDVSNTEVVSSIEQMPYFQRNGEFDTLIYNDVLRYAFKISPRDFEEGVRNRLKISKMFNQETANIIASEDEIYQAYVKKNEKIQVSYALINPEQFKNESDFNEEKAQSFYEQNKSKFILPSSINVEYLEVESGASAAADQKPADNSGASQKADSIYQELISSQDINVVAKNNNLEVKSTGFFSIEEPNLALGWSFDLFNTILKLKINEISGPLETSKGFIVVRLKEKKESYVPTYEEIKNKVKDAYLIEIARDRTREKAQEFLKEIKSKLASASFKDFPKTAQELNLQVVQTPEFNRGQYLPVVGISNEFEDAAFNLVNSENKISDVVETSKGFCILYLDHYIKPDTQKLEEDKAALTESLVADKKGRIFADYLTKLRMESGLVDNIAKMRSKK